MEMTHGVPDTTGSADWLYATAIWFAEGAIVTEDLYPHEWLWQNKIAIVVAGTTIAACVYVVWFVMMMVTYASEHPLRANELVNVPVYHTSCYSYAPVVVLCAMLAVVAVALGWFQHDP